MLVAEPRGVPVWNSCGRSVADLASGGWKTTHEAASKARVQIFSYFVSIHQPISTQISDGDVQPSRWGDSPIINWLAASTTRKKLFSGFDGTWNSLAPCLAEIFAISGLLPQHHFNGKKLLGNWDRRSWKPEVQLYPPRSDWWLSHHPSKSTRSTCATRHRYFTR